MKKGAVNRKKPMKNYVILGVIVLVTVLLVTYLCLWYKEYQEYQSTIPVLRGTILEVTDVELSHYIQENDTAVIYLCVPSNSKCRNFETDLKKLIEKQQWKDNLTYLNLEDDVKADAILQNLTDQYQITQSLTRYPAFLLFENGTVTEVLQGTGYTDLSMGEVEQFFEVHQIN